MVAPSILNVPSAFAVILTGQSPMLMMISLRSLLTSHILFIFEFLTSSMAMTSFLINFEYELVPIGYTLIIVGIDLSKN